MLCNSRVIINYFDLWCICFFPPSLDDVKDDDLNVSIVKFLHSPTDSVRDDFRYSFEGHRTDEDEEEEEEDQLEEEDEEYSSDWEDQIQSRDYNEEKEKEKEAEDRRRRQRLQLLQSATSTPPQPIAVAAAAVEKPTSTPSTGASKAPLSVRQQLTHFNALRSDDDPSPVLMGDHALRFSHRGDGMELFQDLTQRLSSRRPPQLQLRHQRRRRRRNSKRRRRRRRRRHLSSSLPTFEYSWTRNGELLDVEGGGGGGLFELTKEGTLRISYSEQGAAGVYRCVINGTRWNFGALISRESNVKLAGELRVGKERVLYCSSVFCSVCGLASFANWRQLLLVLCCRVYAIECGDKCDGGDWQPIGFELSNLQCACGQCDLVL